jgi:hypothetical protein
MVIPTGSLGACSSGSGSGSGCVCGLSTPMLRAIGAEFLGSVSEASDYNNMVEWVYNFVSSGAIDLIPWGSVQTGLFYEKTQTSPTSTQNGPISGVLTGSQNELWIASSTAPNYTLSNPPCYALPAAADDGAPGVVYFAQAYLPTPTAYYIIAWGGPTDASLSAECGQPVFWVSSGCIFPQQADDQYPMIVDLPIPDYSLDTSILVQNYYIGIITPGAGYSSMNGPSFAVQQDLTGVTAASLNMNGLGPNWASSIANPCYAATSPSLNDPFNDMDLDP